MSNTQTTVYGSVLHYSPRYKTRGFTLVESMVVVALLALLATLVVSNLGSVRAQAEMTVAESTLRSLREAICGAPTAPGYLDDMKRVPGFRSARLRLHDLFDPSSYPAAASFDPEAKRGWRGPYLHQTTPVQNTNLSRIGLFPAAGERRYEGDRTFLERGFFTDLSQSEYGRAGDVAIGDPWGNPIVLQIPLEEAFALPASDAKRFRYARLVSAGPDGVLQTPCNRLAGMQSDGSCTLRGDDHVLFLTRPDTYANEEP